MCVWGGAVWATNPWPLAWGHKGEYREKMAQKPFGNFPEKISRPCPLKTELRGWVGIVQGPAGRLESPLGMWEKRACSAHTGSKNLQDLHFKISEM